MIERLDDLSNNAAKAILKHDYVRVISHHDADGITAAGIMCTALSRAQIQFKASILSRLDEEYAKEIDDPIVVICDMGGSQPDLIDKIKSEVIILDHHAPLGEHLGRIHVNPHLVGIDGSFELSASGVSYKVAVSMGDNVDLSGLAITGAIGDMQQMVSANKDILDQAANSGAVSIKKGLNIGEGDIHELLEFNTEPYLDISGEPDKVDEFLDSLSVSGKLSDLKSEELKKLTSSIVLKLLKKSPTDVIENLIGDVFVLNREVESNALNLVRMLNSAGKLKKTGLALSLCLRDKSGVNEAYELYIYLQKRLIDEIKKAKENTNDEKSVYVAYTNDEDIPSALASTLIRYVFTDKPVIVIAPLYNFAKVSARGTKKLISDGLDLSVAMREAASRIGGVGGGHNIASGASIPVEKQDEFINILDGIVSDQLS